MFCNHTVALHKVQCIGRRVQGLHAEALAIAPHQTLVGSRGHFVKMMKRIVPWPLHRNSMVLSLLPKKPQALATHASLKMCHPI